MTNPHLIPIHPHVVPAPTASGRRPSCGRWSRAKRSPWTGCWGTSPRCALPPLSLPRPLPPSLYVTTLPLIVSQPPPTLTITLTCPHLVTATSPHPHIKKRLTGKAGSGAPGAGDAAPGGRVPAAAGGAAAAERPASRPALADRDRRPGAPSPTLTPIQALLYAARIQPHLSPFVWCGAPSPTTFPLVPFPATFCFSPLFEP